jgi:hypothetical protein
MLVRTARVRENSVVAIHALERKGSAQENLVLLLVALEPVSMKINNMKRVMYRHVSGV